MIDTNLQAALDVLAASERLGVFTDIDGTISPIAPTPAAALVDYTCHELLSQLADVVPVVAAVTGRAALDAHAMIGLDSLVYIGNHGLERWMAGAVVPVPEVAPFVAPIAAVLMALETEPLPQGVLLENKGATASVHYRLADDELATAQWLLDRLTPLCTAADLLMMPGRKIIEIRPPLALNKGTAITSLLNEAQLTAAIFLGDDVTDVDGFTALQAVRSPTRPMLAVGVLSDETPTSVIAASDLQVQGIDGVAAVLAALLAARKA